MHRGVVVDLLDLRNPGQDVVADIAFLTEELLESLINMLMQRKGKISADQDVPVYDKPLDLFIAEEVFRICHGGRPFS